MRSGANAEATEEREAKEAKEDDRGLPITDPGVLDATTRSTRIRRVGTIALGRERTGTPAGGKIANGTETVVSEVSEVSVASAETAAIAGAETTKTDHRDASGTETCSRRGPGEKVEIAEIGIVATATATAGESGRGARRLLRASGSLRPT